MRESIFPPSPVAVGADENLSPQFDDTMEPASPLQASTPVARGAANDALAVTTLEPPSMAIRVTPSTTTRWRHATPQRAEEAVDLDYTDMSVSIPRTPNDEVVLLGSSRDWSADTSLAPVDWDGYDSAASASVVSRSSSSSPKSRNVQSNLLPELQLSEVRARRPTSLQSASLESPAAPPTDSSRPALHAPQLLAKPQVLAREPPEAWTPVISSDSSPPGTPPVSPVKSKSAQGFVFLGMCLAALLPALIAYVFISGLSVSTLSVVRAPSREEAYRAMPAPLAPMQEPVKTPLALEEWMHINNSIIAPPKQQLAGPVEKCGGTEADPCPSKTIIVAKQGKLRRFFGGVKRALAFVLRLLVGGSFAHDVKDAGMYAEGRG